MDPLALFETILPDESDDISVESSSSGTPIRGVCEYWYLVSFDNGLSNSGVWFITMFLSNTLLSKDKTIFIGSSLSLSLIWFSLLSLWEAMIRTYFGINYSNLIGRRFRRALSMPSAILGIYVGGWPWSCQGKIILLKQVRRSINLTTIHISFSPFMLSWWSTLTATDLSRGDVYTPSLRVRAF